ncbi:acylneuraminate cytidylyltransferase [Clostridium estertheticum]|uniref:Acylneuraminate cytidylyltransferase n=1 Tax=Clostridium estertheticum TaxID=238834 RepID=A0A5N7J396_9CLOT|nr:glycosyltransferase family protein [Clostridium estertheticum]MPQ32552.1 acylneuraminate cytidylyltransferase [Clostridium estertheticum]MPQ63211.1 acylneuraminate cytidylyltransferase [Clostridium estertheticum]
MKVTAIIQARMGSTRLPEKVMMKIKDKTVIQHVVERVKAAKNIDDIIIATTLNKSDCIIQEEAEKLGVKCFRGSEEDVLARYYLAAKQNSSDIIIRITSDCPVMDYKIIEKMIEKFLVYNKKDKIDYMSNFDVVPNTFPRGMDIEIFTFAALEKTYKETSKKYEREHVTPYIYENIDMFKIRGFMNNENFSKYRFTLDTIEDFRAISTIYNYLYDENEIFGLEEIINLVKNNTFIEKINNNVKQKKLNE